MGLFGDTPQEAAARKKADAKRLAGNAASRKKRALAKRKATKRAPRKSDGAGGMVFVKAYDRISKLGKVTTVKGFYRLMSGKK